MRYRARLADGGKTIAAPLIGGGTAVAVEVELVEENEGWFVFPKDALGNVLWDQWYQSLEVAKRAAEAEFDDERLVWEPLEEVGE